MAPTAGEAASRGLASPGLKPAFGSTLAGGVDPASILARGGTAAGACAASRAADASGVGCPRSVSYTHLRAHETLMNL
eukprot:5035444-Prymnesium_polylepis.1